MSIASMILGIFGLLTAGSISFGALVLNILAIVFGAIGKSKEHPKMGKAGFIMGIIGASVVVIGILLP